MRRVMIVPQPKMVVFDNRTPEEKAKQSHVKIELSSLKSQSLFKGKAPPQLQLESLDQASILLRRENSALKPVQKTIEAGIEPETIENYMIHYLAQTYLNKYPNKSMLHSNQEIANKMKDKPKESWSAKERWNFLINIYQDLDDPRGTLAKSIVTFFEKSFSCTFQLSKFFTQTHFVPGPVPHKFPKLASEISVEMQTELNRYFLQLAKIEKLTETTRNSIS